MTRTSRGLALLTSLIAVTPVITALLTWNTSNRLSSFEDSIRRHSWPVLFLECCIVLLACTMPASIRRVLTSLKRWQRYMLGLILVSALVSAADVGLYQTETWIGNATWLIHFLFAFGLFVVVDSSNEASLNRFLPALAIGTIAYGILTVWFVESVPEPETFKWTFQMPAVVSYRHIGYFVAPALGAMIAYHIINSRYQAITLLAVCALSCFGSWTGSRGIFLALMGGIAAVMVAYAELRSSRRWLWPIVLMAVGITVSSWLPTPTSNFGLVHRLAAYTRQDPPEFTSKRIDVWRETLVAISEEPWFGHAVDQYRYRMPTRIHQSLNHPHNLVLQILYQWGIVGSVGFFSLLFLVWTRTTRLARQTGLQAMPAFLVLNTLLAYSLFDGTGYYSLPIAIMIITGVGILGSPTAQKIRKLGHITK